MKEIKEIFVSYASADQAVADRLVRGLERHGLSCWIASREIKPGADYQSSIATAIEASTAVVVLYSRNALASVEIPKEMSLASRKPLIPLRIENIAPAGAFRYQLANAQYVDMFSDFEGKLTELCVYLDEACKKAGEVAKRAHTAVRRRSMRSWAVRAGLAINAILAAQLAWRSAPALHAALDGVSSPASTALASAAPGARSDAVQPPVTAVPVPAVYMAPPAQPQGPEAAARDFTLQYYRAVSGPAEAGLAFVSAAMFDPLRFYGQMMTKDRLLDIQRSYFERWPERHMTVRPDSLAASCARNGQVCQVSGVVDYSTKSRARNAAASGAEQFTLQIAGTAPGLHITSISSSAVVRHNSILNVDPAVTQDAALQASAPRN
jgi:hypothetical protein